MFGVFSLDSLGKPIPVDAGDLLGLADAWNPDYRRVGFSSRDGVTVITSFLVLIHWSQGAPLLWETSIEGGPLNGVADRYISLEEAVEGHKKVVAYVFGERPPKTFWGPLTPDGRVIEPPRLTRLERLLGEPLV